MGAFNAWWQLNKEKEAMNDPIYETLQIEEILQKPIPEGCRRIVYRDVQTNQLKTVVVCGP